MILLRAKGVLLTLEGQTAVLHKKIWLFYQMVNYYRALNSCKKIKSIKHLVG